MPSAAPLCRFFVRLNGVSPSRPEIRRAPREAVLTAASTAPGLGGRTAHAPNPPAFGTPLRKEAATSRAPSLKRVAPSVRNTHRDILPLSRARLILRALTECRASAVPCVIFGAVAVLISRERSLALQEPTAQAPATNNKTAH